MRGHREEPSGADSEQPDLPDPGERFFEQMVAQASDAVVTADAEGTIVYANEAVDDLLGYAPEDLVGAEFTEFVPERFQDRYESWHQRYAEGEDGTPLSDETFELTWRTADGEERRLSVSAFESRIDGERLITGFLRSAPERGATGELLREEQALVEELFETSPVAISVRDADGELVRANDRAAELVGVDPDELSEIAEDEGAVEEWSLYDPDGNPREHPVRQTLRTGEPLYNEEIIVERSDGDRAYLSASVTPIYEDGEIERVVTAAEDVTELKETQFELERRRAELETELSEVFARIDDAFFALNDGWEFTYVNDEAEDLLRRTEAELIGKRLWEEFPDAVDSTFEREYRTAMETQEPTSFVEYYPPLSTWFEVHAYPSETGLSVYFQDVTDRIERERELERYETIVETVEDGIFVLNDDMELSMVNSAITRMTGYDREELVGTPVWEFVDDVEHLRDDIEALDVEMYEGERDAATMELDVVTKDGGTVPVEATWVLRESDGEYERVGVIRDITERKERERELQERVQQQRAVATFSQQVLRSRPLDDLFDEAVELVCDTLGHDYCMVMELHPEDDELLLRNGVGWREGIVGSAAVDDDRGSQAGYTLVSESPVTVEDLETEDRFTGSDLLTSHDVKSGISTIIGSPDDPWGILGTHDAARQSYADHDVQFVQSVAHILTTAIRRRERKRQLERYETIVETADDGIYVVGADGTLSMVNSAFTEITGYDENELLGRSPSMFYGEDIERTVAELQAEIIAGERTSGTVEHDLETASGERIRIESTFVVRPADEGTDGDGRERIGILRDITERKERKAELEWTKKRFKKVFEASQDAIFINDPHEDEILDANPAGCEMLGYSREELLTRGPSDFHPDEMETFQEFVDEVYDEGSGWTDELTCLHRSGHRIPVEMSASQIEFDGKKRMVAIVRDITERKRFEQTLTALHESSRELLQLETADAVCESVLETTTDVLGIPGVGIYLYDEDESELAPAAISEYVADLFGDLPSFTPGDESITWRAFAEDETVTFDDVLETDLPYRDDTPLRSGIWIPLGDHGVLAVVSEEVDAFGPDDRELADLLAATTEAALDRVERERERRQHERKLEEQNERLDAFASMLAHELRNPLEIAQIYLGMGVDRLVDDDADTSTFDEVERALDRIEEMIDTLLVVTRRGGTVDTTEVVDLGESAREWWANIDPRGTLVVETDRLIRADSARLRQMLENLYRNAEEHAGPGVTVRVGDLEDVSASEASGGSTDSSVGGFYVEDDGPGIPEDERGQVFEPGYSTSNVGIGFGLAVVRQLVEAHDWHCEITESEDGGARFEFTGVDTLDE